MAKNTYTKEKIVNLIGTLVKDEDSNYIVQVDTKDGYIEVSLNEVLEDCLETEITIKSVEAL